MISFITLDEKNARELAESLSGNDPGTLAEIREILESFLPALCECEIGLCRFEDFLLVRIYDGEMYAFVYPIALRDGLDERNALLEIGRYTQKEEIPLLFCDVPEDCVSSVEESFRFTECAGDGDGCTVRVLSELSRLSDIPKLSRGELSLTALREEDIPAFARLSRDSELNKYWGYDFREDIADAPDRYFYDTAAAAERDGVALSRAVRYGGELVGEVIIWGFDLHGGASLAFRVLPEWQGRGIGGSALSLLLELGGEIGLLELRASVMCENLPSKRLLDRHMVCIYKGEKVNKYLHKY